MSDTLIFISVIIGLIFLVWGLSKDGKTANTIVMFLATLTGLMVVFTFFYSIYFYYIK